MNFINSILLFFAFLIISPSLFNNNQDKFISNAVIVAPKSSDPYAETILIRGGTFAMGMNQESVDRKSTRLNSSHT